jgi:2-polyprenyl-6-hydroxyphenyl methylase/3-demethylubiquinone-9 3-methyltransferase
MALGPRVRGWLGRWEPRAAAAYRALFFDVRSLARAAAAWTPATRILEIGCGEGALTDALADAYPTAQVTGIDVTPRVGRLSRANPARVAFRQVTLDAFWPDHAGTFDLAVICDVLHHVPRAARPHLLALAGRTLRPRGRLVLKDWARRPTPIHLMGYLGDRYLTGDRVRYASADELRALVAAAFGEGAIERELRLPPWANNLALFVKPRPGEREGAGA